MNATAATREQVIAALEARYSTCPICKSPTVAGLTARETVRFVCGCGWQYTSKPLPKAVTP